MGVRFGIDVGKARIGVAKSDPAGLLATPLETVQRADVWDDIRFLLRATEEDGAHAGVATAAGESAGILPLPQAVQAEASAALAAGELTDIAHILGLLAEYDCQLVCVGHPRNLRGAATPSTRDAELFALVLAAALREAGSAVDVWLVDERLSTVTATAQLASAGRRGKNTRQIVDQAAAVVILQQALETERNLGRMQGIPVVARREGDA